MRAFALLLVACQAPAPPPPPTKLVIAQLGVKIAAPPGSRVLEGGGPDAVLLESRAHADCLVLVWREDPTATPTPIEGVLADLSRVKQGPGRVREMQREERLPSEGYRLEWTEEREDKTQLFHAVQDRIQVGARWYGCGRKVPSKEAQACVRAACDSLEPL
jgi:hypothetical protein